MTQKSIAILTARSGVRRRLLGILEAESTLTVVATVSNLEHLVGADETPNVVVVDPGPENGSLRAVRISSPEAVLVAVVSGVSSQRMRVALAEGADGVVMLERLDTGHWPDTSAAALNARAAAVNFGAQRFWDHVPNSLQRAAQKP